MKDKLLKLFNVKTWLEGVIFQKVVTKGLKFATGALLGLLAGPKVAPTLAEYLPKLKEFGIDIQPEQFVTVGTAFLFGALANWIKRIMEKQNIETVK